MAISYNQTAPNFLDDGPAAAHFAEVARIYHESHGEPSDIVRVIQLKTILDQCKDLEPGDYLELGVHRGFTLRVIHEFMDNQASLYGLDTFEGFDHRDVNLDMACFPQHQYGRMDFEQTSAAGVREYVKSGSSGPDRLNLIEGWFPKAFDDYFRSEDDSRWRFVHIDFDLYEPCRKALGTIWNQMVPGGFVLVHDYGCLGFPGPKRAVDEFCADFGQRAVILPDRWGTAVVRKP